MTILVLNDTSLATIQDAFHAEYPYLKLAFFSKKHDAYKSSHAKFMISDKTATVGSVRAEGGKEGQLNIEPTMPVWQLERLFEEEFGLHVQVFRKSGSIWLETSVTDDLTLETQNAKGKASEHMETPIADPMDYREMD